VEGAHAPLPPRDCLLWVKGSATMKSWGKTPDYSCSLLLLVQFIVTRAVQRESLQFWCSLLLLVQFGERAYSFAIVKDMYLFRSEIFLDFDTVVFSFLFDKHCPIIE